MTKTASKRPGRPVDPGLEARRREEILEAAAKLFARHGYTATDTQILADHLQVGKGTLYRYFPSKEKLFLAAVDRVMTKLRGQVDASIEHLADPLDRIARAVRTFLEYLAENPDFVELLIQERAQFKDRKKPTYFEHRDANIERWHNIYRDLIALGRLRQIPVERIAGVLSQLMYGTMFTNYFRGRHEPPEKQARDIIDIVFNGILSDSERKNRKPD